MCPVKGGADQKTVFDTVRKMMASGATVDEAMAKVESLMRGQLPEHIRALIRQECG